MDLNDAIYHRRSVRRFTEQGVTPVTVNALLDAAIQAPSALNQQPWAFGVFHGRALLRNYSERAKRYLVAHLPAHFEVRLRSELYENPAYDLFHGANTLIVIYAAQGRLHPMEDCSLAAENLMLTAYSLGLGTCPIGFARPWFDLSDVKDELGIGSNFTAVFPMVVGYANGPNDPVPRNPPDILAWKWTTDQVSDQLAAAR